jgi:putative transposase
LGFTASFNGLWFRGPALIDDFTRESPGIKAGQGITGKEVAEAPDQIIGDRSKPETVQCDNGPEFTSKGLDLWAYENKATLDFSRPGKPTDNGYMESFNGRLNDEWFKVVRGQGKWDRWWGRVKVQSS